MYCRNYHQSCTHGPSKSFCQAVVFCVGLPRLTQRNERLLMGFKCRWELAFSLHHTAEDWTQEWLAVGLLLLQHSSVSLRRSDFRTIWGSTKQKNVYNSTNFRKYMSKNSRGFAFICVVSQRANSKGGQLDDALDSWPVNFIIFDLMKKGKIS